MRKFRPGQANPAQTFNKIISAQKQVKSAAGAPQFPGITAGMSVDQVRELIKSQPRCTGVSFVAPAGPFNINNIQLPGDARVLLGIMFTPTPDVDNQFSMVVNNNKIIDAGSIYLHSSDNGYTIDSQYYKYMQPLTGKDLIQIDLTTINGMAGIVQIHYI